jgi:nitroreductase
MYATDLLSVRDAAVQRRSIREFTAEAIPEAELAEMLRLVGLAPSAFNLQPWRFVVVREAGLKAQLADAALGQRQVSSAPVVIVLYTDMGDTLLRIDEVLHPGMDAAKRASSRASILRRFSRMDAVKREAWGAEQGHIALGYLLLIAESHGYQTSAMAGFDPAAVRELLTLPPHVPIPALVAVGRGAAPGFDRHRHPLERIARFA